MDVRFRAARIIRARLAMGLCAVWLASCETGFAQQQPPPRIIDKVAKQYEVVAEKFDRNPTDNKLSQEVFKVLMVAEALQLKKFSHPMKTRLLMQAPQSLQARYLLTTFATPDDYRKLLIARFDEEEHQITHEFGKQFIVAVQLGATRWPQELMTGDEFLLKSALAAQSGYSHTVLAECRDRLAKLDNESSRIAEIVFGEMTDNQKYVELAKFRKNRHSHCFVRQIYQSLDAEAAMAPEVMRIRIARLLTASQFADALPMIEQLLEQQPSDQARFWRGWTQAATGDIDGALESLSSLSKDSESEWAAAGSRLHRTLGELADSSTALEQATAKVVEHFLDNRASRISATGRYLPFALDATLVADFDNSALGLHFAERGETTVAFLVKDGETKLFVAEDNRTIGSRGKPTYPLVGMKLNRRPDGKFSFKYSLGASHEKSGMRQWTDELFSSRWFATEAGRRELLTHHLRIGMFPTPPEKRPDGSTVFGWIAPRVESPDFKQGKIVLDQQFVLRQLKIDQFELTSIAYGDEPVDFTQIRFPDGPVQWRDSLGGSAFFKMMGAIFAVVERQTETRKLAEKPTEKR
jgi:hypothetical protein